MALRYETCKFPVGTDVVEFPSPPEQLVQDIQTWAPELADGNASSASPSDVFAPCAITAELETQPVDTVPGKSVNSTSNFDS